MILTNLFPPQILILSSAKILTPSARTLVETFLYIYLYWKFINVSIGVVSGIIFKDKNKDILFISFGIKLNFGNVQMKNTQNPKFSHHKLLFP